MAQMLVKLDDHENRVLTIVKGKYGLKNKSDAIKLVINKFEEDRLEPELRPEYAEKMKRIQKQKPIHFKNVEALRKHIENA